MADENDDDLELKPADAGAGFRFEMAATNFVLGYWRVLLGTLIATLLAVLFYGEWSSWVQHAQRATSGQIAEVERGLPAPLLMLAAQGTMGTDPVALAGAARQLEDIGNDASRTARIEALLKAAELYRMAGDNEGRRRTLEAAAQDADGVLRFAALSALGALDLQDGQGDKAVERYRALMQDGDPFLAQEAAIDLGFALEHLDRKAEAATVYADFLAKWPDASRASEVRDHQARLGSAG